ncbi:hypothetical protein GUJ93_ZPchr0013g34562 [Zizania palustris]|uniref:Uncharacterized protein n=1 Tax=Zizania palustris TaxID=103762 RepID=A0A8J5WXE0_ZIZPA|nr:hypothetical protein GUJ93_ZPchr0013g34562 [Zizania palustris]
MLGKGAKVVPNTLDQISILTRGFLADLGGLNPDAEETVGGYRSAAGRAYEVVLLPLIHLLRTVIFFCPMVLVWLLCYRREEVTTPLLKFMFGFVLNKSQRLTFDSSSPNEIMLFRYEGRCGLPTNFDSSYCYALCYDSGALLHFGKTRLITLVANLAARVEEWTVVTRQRIRTVDIFY